MSESIKEYWDQRAQENAGSQTATTNDVYQRELEITSTIAVLRRLGLGDGDRLLDVGCGDGYSTLALARAFPEVTVLGVDYSPSMIELASRNAVDNARFCVGDVTQLDLGESFSFAVSMRCLINLGSKEAQADALGRIARHVTRYYLALENFVEGHDQLNRARAAVGLQPIPIRWHNLYFSEPDFRAWAEPRFDSVEIENFSSAYYYATRVIYSKMCQMRGEQPDYRHEIHQLAVNLSPFGNFSPIRLGILHRRAA